MHPFQAELIPAMVTPFRKDESVDFEAAERLAVHLLDNGCDGLLVNGTTGESPTLTMDERIELIRTVKHAIAGRKVPLIAGVGTNDTRRSVEEARKLASLGLLDALLVVVPYYNKPSQRGMQEHFRQIAQAVDLPIIIYNIPGRCVVQMQAETMAALHAECPNIVGVKQSVADMDALSAITALLPKESWRTWCGDDSLTLPMLSLGATGTISVSAHLVGKQMRDMIQAFKAGDHARALKLHCALLQVNRELFFLPNPTVVKSCLARLGLMEGTLRPPMVAPEGDEELRIQKLCSGLKHLIAVGA